MIDNNTPEVGVIDVNNESTEDTIERLSSLSSIEYEKVRTEEAKKLNMRVSALDSFVYQEKRLSQPEPENNSIIENLEPWPDPVNITWIVEEIKKQINNFCILPDNYLSPLVAWIIGTYCFNSFRIYPKLCIYSPQKRCGKSTLMEVLDALTSNALMASNVSPAVIYRVIEVYQPTLLLDEADTWLVGRNVNDEMRGIINSGHTKTTAKVLRCDGDKSEPKAFSTWAPMVIGMIGKPPSTIVDRSIMLPMRRKLKDETVFKLPVDFKALCVDLRRAILRWVNDNGEQIKAIQLTPPKLTNDRAMDNWTSLLILAQYIGEPLLTEVSTSYFAINNEDTDEEDIGIELLKDIRSIFDMLKVDRIHSQVLVMQLTLIEGRPWAEWKHGKPMTANSLSRLLKPFNIRPKDIRENTIVKKGYDKKEFLDAFDRYI